MKYTPIKTQTTATNKKTQLTKLQFRNRFTIQEKATIELAQIDDVTAEMEVRQQQAMLRALCKDLEAAEFIDCRDTLIVEGVGFLETMGILEKGRALEILT